MKLRMEPQLVKLQSWPHYSTLTPTMDWSGERSKGLKSWPHYSTLTPTMDRSEERIEGQHQKSLARIDRAGKMFGAA